MCEGHDCMQFTVNRQFGKLLSGNLLTAGFMSLNKLGDKYKVLIFTIDSATVCSF